MDSKKIPIIFLDIETTGVNTKVDSIIELAFVKVMGDLDLYDFDIQNPDIFHTYVKNEADITADSFKVHGISEDFLKDKPRFDTIIDEIMNFIGTAPLVAHNANFDVSFLNAALVKNKREKLKNPVIDSLSIARKLYPGSQVGLDALMRRFGMHQRSLHSALEDAVILSKIYVAMHAPRQDVLFTDQSSSAPMSFGLCRKVIS